MDSEPFFINGTVGYGFMLPTPTKGTLRNNTSSSYVLYLRSKMELIIIMEYTSEPAQELHSRAAPSVEAHHR